MIPLSIETFEKSIDELKISTRSENSLWTKLLSSCDDDV